MRPALVAVTALSLLLAGCGGVEREPNLAKASKRTKATGSTRFEITGLGTPDGQRVEVSCQGAADYARRRFRLMCDAAEGLDETEMVAIGDTTYMRTDATAALGISKRWVKLPAGEVQPLQDFSPEKLLALLGAASRQTERVGEDDVRGEPTVRYRLTVVCDKAEIGGCQGETTPVDVWIDDGGLVRRIVVDDTGVTGTIEFFDFGIEVDIEAPPADQISELGSGAIPGSGDATPCFEGEATPISESQALDALRRHGLSVESEGRECFGGVAAVFDNAPDDFKRQGSVSCFLYAKLPHDAPKAVDRRGTDGGDARLALANLVCTILADNPNAEERIDPLEEAFAELQRAVRP